MVQEIGLLFLGKYLIFILFLLLGILYIRGERRLVASALVAVLLAQFFTVLIGYLLPTPRPFSVFGLPVPSVFFFGSWAPSFPSGHTATAIALATAVWLKHRRLGVVLFVAGLLVGAARVLLLAHFWPDIFGGVFLGILCGFYGGDLLTRWVLPAPRRGGNQP